MDGPSCSSISRGMREMQYSRQGESSLHSQSAYEVRASVSLSEMLDWGVMKGNLLRRIRRWRKSSLSSYWLGPRLVRVSQSRRQARKYTMSLGLQCSLQQSTICYFISSNSCPSSLQKMPVFRNRIHMLSKLLSSLMALLEYFLYPLRANKICSLNTSFSWKQLISTSILLGLQAFSNLSALIICSRSSLSPCFLSKAESYLVLPALKNKKALPQMHPSCGSSMYSPGQSFDRYLLSSSEETSSLLLDRFSSQSSCKAKRELVSSFCMRAGEGACMPLMWMFSTCLQNIFQMLWSMFWQRVRPHSLIWKSSPANLSLFIKSTTSYMYFFRLSLLRLTLRKPDSCNYCPFPPQSVRSSRFIRVLKNLSRSECLETEKWSRVLRAQSITLLKYYSCWRRVGCTTLVGVFLLSSSVLYFLILRYCLTYSRRGSMSTLWRASQSLHFCLSSRLFLCPTRFLKMQLRCPRLLGCN